MGQDEDRRPNQLSALGGFGFGGRGFDIHCKEESDKYLTTCIFPKPRDWDMTQILTNGVGSTMGTITGNQR